jgi:NDP-sugar pyrophosphorylase family protein
MPRRIKQFAIIAAGEGRRLSEEGVSQPKALVCLNGEPLLTRLVRIFHSCGAERIVIIVNDLHPQTAQHVSSLITQPGGERIHLVVQTTPSSMHSFHALSKYLTDEPFCLTTVDTIFRETDFRAYLDYFAQSDADGVMGVTDFVDDEKPLYVATNETLDITAFLDASAACKYISGGIYGLTAPALKTLQRCMAEGQSRMRNYQRGLLVDGLRLKAFPFSKILDVDHASDIPKAEAFLFEK